MRIIIFTSQFPPGSGGIGTHAHQLAFHLKKMGWEVLVISTQPYATEEEITKFNQAQPFSVVRLRLVPFAPFKLLYRWVIGSHWIQKFKPDVLLASGDRDIYLTALLSDAFRLPWVAIEHGRLPKSWEAGVKRWAFAKATRTICVSKYTWNQMIKMGIKPKDGKVIPNGADTQIFTMLSEEKISRFKNEKKLKGNLLVTVGNVTERKGQDTVIRALPHILKKAPETHYLILGVPTKQKEFAAIAENLGVQKHVHFMGQVNESDLIHYLNASDIFIMTSRFANDEFEGYGIAVVEAALCGKPAVVSANSGLSEAIQEGETGLGVSETDEKDVANAVLSLLLNPKRKEQMGQKAKERALREQTWEKRVPEYDAVLRKLIA
jgi:phosphatidyl-myo-inositol dimannoside synthase